MKNKFWFLVKHTLSTKFFNKAFLFINIGIFALMLLIANIPNIINTFVSEEVIDATVYVVNDTDGEVFTKDKVENIFKILKEQDSSYKNSNFSFDILESQSNEDYIEKITDTEDIILVFYTEDSDVKLNYYSNDPLSISNSALVNTIYQTLYFSYIGNTPPNIENINGTIITDELSEEHTTMLRTLFPMLFGMPLFLLMILAVTFTGTEIIEEKSSKMIEIVLTNVKSSLHLLSKIIAVTVGITSQLILTFIYGIFASFIAGLLSGSSNESSNAATESVDLSVIIEALFGDSLDRLFVTIILTVIFLAIGLLSFSVLSGMFAATASNVQDFNKVITPLTLIMLIGYMINVMAGSLGDRAPAVMKFASFIPLVSFQITPAAYLLGDLTIIDVIISVLINVIFAVFILKLSFSIYKEALLNFSEGSPFKVLFNSFKRRKQNKKKVNK